MDQLRKVLFGEIETVRIHAKYTQPDMARTCSKRRRVEPEYPQERALVCLINSLVNFDPLVCFV